MPSPFFKCYPSDFLNGVAELTPHALAVYTICMMRMYDEDGPIPDDPVKIARRCNMRLPTCKKALEELESDGKIVRSNGMIINPRVQEELQKRLEMRVKQSRNARGTDRRKLDSAHGGQNNDNKYKGPGQPTPSQNDATDEPTRVRSQRLEVRKKEREVSVSKRPPTKRGTRLTKDWVLPAEWSKWATSQGHPNPSLEAETFRDYWIAASGRNAVKLDWQATWRNWVRRCDPVKQRASHMPPKALSATERREMDELVVSSQNEIEGARNARMGQ